MSFFTDIRVQSKPKPLPVQKPVAKNETQGLFLLNDYLT